MSMFLSREHFQPHFLLTRFLNISLKHKTILLEDHILIANQDYMSVNINLNVNSFLISLF